ncbi:MAG: tRNA lysidine(34) synthetase TilS [Negativicutes bacterium]|jgi:tRNA(Ile)-lysidine synthase
MSNHSRNCCHIAEICEQAVNNAISPETQCLIVACSGGVDSIVLLDIIEKFCKKTLRRLVCAHVNHGLRGVESDTDEQFLKDYCQKRKITFECKRVDVRQEQKQNKAGVEAAARELRYAALREIAAAYQPGKIFVAHNKNDQAETLLLQLIRGAGLRGLSAMQSETGDVIRPLLTVSRDDIEKYCVEYQLEYRFDSSNNDAKILRNSVRQKLLPLLTEYNPNIIQTLSRTAKIIRAEESCMHDFASALEADCVEYREEKAYINKNKLSKLHIALQRRVLILAVSKLGSIDNLAFEKVEQLRKQTSGRLSTIVEIGGKLQSRNCYEHLELCYNNPSGNEVTEPVSSNLSIPSVNRLSDCEQLQLELIDSCDNELSTDGRFVYYFDYNKLKLPLVVRNRKSGDSVQLSYGNKALKKLFIEKKIPSIARAHILLVSDSEKILAILGVTASKSAIVSGETTKVLKITYIKEKKNARQYW